MKICVSARMDHSKFLASGLASKGALGQYTVFGYFQGFLRKFEEFYPRSLRTKFRGKRLDIPDELVKSSFLIFLFDQIAARTSGRIHMLSQYLVHRAFEHFCIRKLPQRFDVFHYWSLYFGDSLLKLRSQYRNVRFLADVYEAYPLFVDEIVRKEYRRLGFDKKEQNRDSKYGMIARYAIHDPIVVPSEYVKRSFEIYFPKKKIFVNHFGVFGSRGRFKHFAPRRNLQLKIIYCGWVSIEKGAHTLLEAAAARPNLSFTLVGSVDPKVKILMQRYAPLSNVRLLGQVPQLLVPQLLEQHDLYLHPSLSDAFSLSVSEAIAAGLPTVVSENTGNAEVISRYGLGDVFKTSDTNDLLRILDSVNDEWLFETNVRIKESMSALTWDCYVDRMTSIYEQLLQDKA